MSSSVLHSRICAIRGSCNNPYVFSVDTKPLSLMFLTRRLADLKIGNDYLTQRNILFDSLGRLKCECLLFLLSSKYFSFLLPVPLFHINDKMQVILKSAFIMT